MGDTVDTHRTDRPSTAQPPPRPAPPGALVVHDVMADRLYGQGLDELADDLRERGEFGRRKHGTPLHTGDGRRSLAAAYEESLDTVAYLAKLDMQVGEQDGSRSAAAGWSSLLLRSAVDLAEQIRIHLRDRDELSQR